MVERMHFRHVASASQLGDVGTLQHCSLCPLGRFFLGYRSIRAVASSVARRSSAPLAVFGLLEDQCVLLCDACHVC